MTPKNRTKAVAAAWTVAILAIAFIANVSSATSWLIVTVIALGPPLALLHFSKEPTETTSERIQEARR